MAQQFASLTILKRNGSTSSGTRLFSTGRMTNIKDAGSSTTSFDYLENGGIVTRYVVNHTYAVITGYAGNFDRGVTFELTILTKNGRTYANTETVSADDFIYGIDETAGSTSRVIIDSGKTSPDTLIVNHQYSALTTIINTTVPVDQLYQGLITCPQNYPVAKKDQYWLVDTGGTLGAATEVEAGDSVFCIADTAGGAGAAASFMITQKNMIPTTVAVLRTGTNNTDFVTAKTLADNNLAFSAATPLEISGGTTEQLKLTATAGQYALTVAHTAATASSIDVVSYMNSAYVDIVSVLGQASAALSGGEIVGGVASRLNATGADADGSGYSAFKAKTVDITTGQADMVGYAAGVCGVRDTADTSQGVFVSFGDGITGFTQNHANSTTYGLRIGAATSGATGFTHTDGTWYGVHINHGITVTAGAAYGMRVAMALQSSATVTTRAFDVLATSTVDTAHLVTATNVDLTMNGTSAVNSVEASRVTLSSGVQMGTYANAFCAKIDLTDDGYVAGLAGVICAEINLPSNGVTGGSGTYTCFEAEIGMDGVSNGTPVSAMRVGVWGAQAADFDTNGYIFDIDGVTGASGKVFQPNTAADATHALRIRIGGVPYYMMLTSVGA